MAINSQALNTAALNGVAGSSVIYDVAETAVLNDSYDYIFSHLVEETAVLNDAVATYGTFEYDVADDPASALSYVYPYATTIEDVAETAVLDDSVILSDYWTDIAETAVLNDAVTIDVTRQLDLAETAVLNDSYEIWFVYDVAETAVLDDSVVITEIHDILETATLDDAISLLETEILDVEEVAVLNDAVVDTLTALQDQVEEGFISSEAYTFDLNDQTVIWTANVVNWAMSTFSDLEFTDKTDRYAASEDGLYEVATTYADAVVQTGKNDFGTPQLKSMQYAYVYAEHDVEMDIDVTADVNGEEDTYTYSQMARDATDTRAVRCTFGRGYTSNYYQLTLNSVGYAKIQYCVPVIEELSRRI